MYIQSYIPQINNICKNHFVNELFVFGSVLTDKFSDKSDIDFIVSFDNMDITIYAENYFELIDELERLTKRKVDLVEQKSIRNPIFLRVTEREKRKIYDRKNS